MSTFAWCIRETFYPFIPLSVMQALFQAGIQLFTEHIGNLTVDYMSVKPGVRVFLLHVQFNGFLDTSCTVAFSTDDSMRCCNH